MLQVTVESSSYGERDRDRDRDREKERDRDRDRERERDRERMGINIKAPLVAERLEPLTEKGLLSALLSYLTCTFELFYDILMI